MFDWDDENRRHIGLHLISTDEVEEALGGLALEIDSYVVDGEERFEEVGHTANGRILKVVVTLRNGEIRVVTAYDASRYLKAEYLAYQRRTYE